MITARSVAAAGRAGREECRRHDNIVLLNRPACSAYLFERNFGGRSSTVVKVEAVFQGSVAIQLSMKAR